MLNCVGTETRAVRKGEFILFAGDKPTHIGVVVSGELHIHHEDFDGKRSLIASVTPSEVFAEELCCAGVPESPITVMAKVNSAVMLMDFSRILYTCSIACPFHIKIIVNMLRIVASKSLQLQNRMEIVSIKSVRGKVLRYLESLIPEQGYDIVTPFNREELANFLCVERSALSHELARMKKDGLIEYRKNHFQLNK